MQIEHARNAAGIELCDAGRFAFFDGSWIIPCPMPGIHQILGRETTPYGEPLLCDLHFEQVLDAGLVADPSPQLWDYWRKKGRR